jgi:hypothetical protein
MVYVVVKLGETVTEFPDIPPGDHEYVTAVAATALTPRGALFPSQILVVGSALTTGS